MNDAQQVANILYGTLGLSAVWVLISCWREYKVDKLRQEIFNLRAELFDFARVGKVSFDNNSYVLLRWLLNSMIRFAHEVSFIRLATALVLERWRPMLITTPSFVDVLRTDDSLDASARSKLKELHDELMKLVVVQILTTSIASGPSLILYAACTLIKHGLPERKKRADIHMIDIVLQHRLPSHLRLMEQQAMEARELELQQRETTPCAQGTGSSLR